MLDRWLLALPSGRVFYLEEHKMLIITLSQSFFARHLCHTEILKKETRPYFSVVIQINGLHFAIPFRSHISHKYAYWTDKKNLCGLDFTKAVLIEFPGDIDKTGVQIRQNEFNAIKGKEYHITKKFISFLNTYKKAMARQDVERNRRLIANSAIQYFINDIFT